MNITEALKYVQHNHQYLNEKESKVIGVAYTPINEEAEFYIIDVSLDQEAKEVDGIDYFSIYIEGGHIPSRGFGLEDSMAGEDIAQLVIDTPPFARNIRYRVYEGIGNSYLGMESDYALKKLLPQLPDLEASNFNAKVFKARAIELINEINDGRGDCQGRI